VFPSVWEWSAFSPAHRVDLTAHLVAAAGGFVAVDPFGAPWSWNGGRIVAVALTNGNHDREAAAWGHFHECPVWVPAGAGSTVEGARGFARGESPFAGWESFPLDGGGPGETAFLVPTLGLAVFGDAVVNLPGRALELLPDKYCSDPAALRASLRRLVATPFSRAVFAHGTPLESGAAARIAALL
jgi:glyoxylase-like metal-dependent hydrolase (beta-lactamase superfamily II)